jgi:hypothetical protein
MHSRSYSLPVCHADAESRAVTNSDTDAQSHSDTSG